MSNPIPEPENNGPFLVAFYRSRTVFEGWPRRWFYINREATTDRKKLEKLASKYRVSNEVVIKEVMLP